MSTEVTIITGQASLTIARDELKDILGAAAFTTAKVLRELKEQPLKDLVDTDRQTGKVSMTRLDEELKTLRDLQGRMNTITKLLNEVDRG